MGTEFWLTLVAKLTARGFDAEEISAIIVSVAEYGAAQRTEGRETILDPMPY